jgi:hypothetical protein
MSAQHESSGELSGQSARGSELRPHPNWQRGWHFVDKPLPVYSQVSVQAVDTSGAPFGFNVVAGWPAMAERLAKALVALLEEEANRVG